MCRPNGLLFHQKSLDMGSMLVKKSLEEGPISQKLRTTVKSAIFGVEKPFEIVPICKIFEKKQNKTKQNK